MAIAAPLGVAEAPCPTGRAPGGAGPARRLHIGCGAQRLEGWLNVDIDPLPEVDVALDVRKGLPFKEVDAVFAEHFLEHLEVTDALRFLVNVRNALKGGGMLRLSTPNLEWVLAAHAAPGRKGPEGEAPCIGANRSFYGWGHRFLWSEPLLTRALEASGFENLRWCDYGESERAVFRGIERHERFPDEPGVRHVLIVEGTRGAPQQDKLRSLLADLEAGFLRFLD